MTDDYAGYGEIMERLTSERDRLRDALTRTHAALHDALAGVPVRDADEILCANIPLLAAGPKVDDGG